MYLRKFGFNLDIFIFIEWGVLVVVLVVVYEGFFGSREIIFKGFWNCFGF